MLYTDSFQNSPLSEYDSEIFTLIHEEVTRQEAHIELIASENYVSRAVLEAQGSVLTNKYAEGYPGRRYYGGCYAVDQIEALAINRAKSLFQADYANVQPHSGSQANAAVYLALLNPGDTILGMRLSDGGHLTHGAAVNFSGKMYHTVQYGVNELGELDYAELEALAIQHRPKLIVGGFSAYSRRINWKKMREIADAVGAYLLVDMAHVAGLIAAKLYPDPLPHAHVVTTTTHKTLGGPRGGLILAANGTPEFYKKLDSALFPGIQGGPLLHVIAAKAVALKEAMSEGFVVYQEQVLLNAQTMVTAFQKRGYAIVSGKTENHLFLLDLSQTAINGKIADNVLGKANITVNKNSVPKDQAPPMVTSGIRIGTPAVTRRGFGVKEVTIVADWIADLLDEPTDLERIQTIKKAVQSLCAAFPVYRMDA